MAIQSIIVRIFTLDGSDRNVNDDAIITKILGARAMPRLHILVRIFDPRQGTTPCIKELIQILEENRFPYTIIDTEIFKPLIGLETPNPVVVTATLALSYARHYAVLRGRNQLEPVSILFGKSCFLPTSVSDSFKVHASSRSQLLEHLVCPEIRKQNPQMHGLHPQHLRNVFS